MGCTTSAPEKVVPKTSYINHPEAVIIACYFNPTNSSYRKQHFLKFYESIKHCNYRIIECMIGDDRNLLLPPHDPNIEVCHTNILLWHKECLLNILIKDLDPKYKFVFWLDGDIQFTNMNWIVESVNKLKEECSVLQPFEYAFHLNKDELTPSSTSLFQKDMLVQNGATQITPRESRRVWKSYGANFEQSKYYDSLDYDIHGHVGFAWGIRRSILTKTEGLYDKALIGGGDHIMAHAITSKLTSETDTTGLHICMTKTHNSPEALQHIANWSYRFQKLCNAELGYVKGDIYHYWHGDLSDRNYFHRIRDFSPYLRFINKKENGLYVTDNPQILEYINNYFKQREVKEVIENTNNESNNDNNNDNTVDGNVSSGNNIGHHNKPHTKNHTKHNTQQQMSNQPQQQQPNQSPLPSSSPSYPYQGYYYHEEEQAVAAPVNSNNNTTAATTATATNYANTKTTTTSGFYYHSEEEKVVLEEVEQPPLYYSNKTATLVSLDKSSGSGATYPAQIPTVTTGTQIELSSSSGGFYYHE